MKNILVIDDCEQLRETVVAILDDAGYQVQAVESVTEALDCCQSQRFDFIVCDLVMPVEDEFGDEESSAMVGVSAIRDFSKKYPETKIIAISGELTGAPLTAIQQFGAVKCLSKPFGRDQLLAALG